MLSTIKLDIFTQNFQVVSSEHFILLYRMKAMSYLNMTTPIIQQPLQLGYMQKLNTNLAVAVLCSNNTKLSSKLAALQLKKQKSKFLKT